MQKIGFAEAVERIVAEDPRYHRDVYAFMRDALDFTVKQQSPAARQQKKTREGISNHVTPQQLLEGVRHFALKEFGPMVPTVFGYWNVRSCADLGHIVFNMIRKEILGKNDADTQEQFAGGYDFHDAFVAPFLPEPPAEPASPNPPNPSASLPAETGS